MIYPIVSFSRNGKHTSAMLTLPGYPESLFFYREAANASDAHAVAADLCRVFGDAMLRAKRAAYEQGYKDGRARRTKSQPVYGDLDPENL